MSTLRHTLTLAAVIDGRKGGKEVFSDVPVQMCQYHQLMILRRYLTMNPRLEFCHITITFKIKTHNREESL